MEEERLHGGHVNTVVRVGDTVRRSAGAQTPTVHRLLSHVRERGVRWVPEPLGFDEQGREVLSFVPGHVPHEMPAWVWSERVLLDVARALRQWHDATVDFELEGAVWELPAREPREVVCHTDFAPYNCVFVDERFTGAIDFDLCAPGPRLWDIAYTAYRFVPLMPPRDAVDFHAAGERSPFSADVGWSRLDAFLGAYGAAGSPLRYERARAVAATVERLRAIADWTESFVAKTGNQELGGHAAMYRAHAEWLVSKVASSARPA
jgi:aminoglycoside phosphotransferase (APT) family kinase protein